MDISAFTPEQVANLEWAEFSYMTPTKTALPDSDSQTWMGLTALKADLLDKYKTAVELFNRMHAGSNTVTEKSPKEIMDAYLKGQEDETKGVEGFFDTMQKGLSSMWQANGPIGDFWAWFKGSKVDITREEIINIQTQAHESIEFPSVVRHSHQCENCGALFVHTHGQGDVDHNVRSLVTMLKFRKRD